MIKGRDMLDVRGNEYIIMKYGKKIQTVTEPTTRIMEPLAKTLSQQLTKGAPSQRYQDKGLQSVCLIFVSM